ncbi:MAG: gamma-glutamyltransferase [Saprospiraceae bacterium]|nr:gamma-glutamyltransferase [Saprospiraceae bacterium]
MKQILAFSIIILTLSSLFAQQTTPIYSSDVRHHPIVGENGMVASQHKLATEVGLEILKKGGNAVDAAVAVGFSLAVVLPRAGNLGGGGFMMIHDADENETNTLNYREMAPAKAFRDMYLDQKGDVDRSKVNAQYASAGVPGSVAGMARALELYGTMSLAEVLAPAIKQAEEGFQVTYDLARILKNLERRIRKWPESAKIFYKENGGYYEAGDQLIQKDLAWSLKQIADHGADAFYKGEVGKRIVDDMTMNDGYIEMKDLNNYKVEEVKPVWGSYRGYDIASMPPPSSGGVHVIQMLNILSGFPLGYLGHNTAETLHIMAESMKHAYADRSEHLGDPNFWNVPTQGITSAEYAAEVRSKINRWTATPSDDIKPGKPQDYESEETTHFTVVDKDGNVVVNTYTLNFSFGTGIVAKGTGILLNNEMSDFSAKPGVANAFGLLGGEANAVEPGKRPLSSMTPTMVFKEGKPYFATGSPGGSRIITTVLQVILNIIDHDMNVAEATHAPRIHHQWYPDILYIEKGIGLDTQSLLRNKNHNVSYRSAMGSTQTIMLKNGLLFGSSDPRRPDAATMAY